MSELDQIKTELEKLKAAHPEVDFFWLELAITEFQASDLFDQLAEAGF